MLKLIDLESLKSIHPDLSLRQTLFHIKKKEDTGKEKNIIRVGFNDYFSVLGHPDKMGLKSNNFDYNHSITKQMLSSFIFLRIVHAAKTATLLSKNYKRTYLENNFPFLNIIYQLKLVDNDIHYSPEFRMSVGHIDLIVNNYNSAHLLHVNVYTPIYNENKKFTHMEMMTLPDDFDMNNLEDSFKRYHQFLFKHLINPLLDLDDPFLLTLDHLKVLKMMIV